MIIIKTPEQIDGIRKSSRLAANALCFAGSFVREGETTDRICDIVKEYIHANGGKCACMGYRGFPREICISINNEVCHGIPNKNRKLKNGDIVKIDVTTILNGYYGDTAATFEVGEVSKKAKKLVADTKKCLEIGIAQVRPNNFFGNIGFEINNYAWNEGHTVVYEFAGHGVGIQFHEEPLILHNAAKDSGPVMKEGMIFTIEPMINAGFPKCTIDEWDGWTVRTADGSLSAQFEHTVLVTENGVEILTLTNDGCFEGRAQHFIRYNQG